MVMTTLIIPANLPPHTRDWLAHINRWVADAARHRYDGVSDDQLIDAAAWLARTCQGETHYFAQLWLRLFKAQAAGPK
jgi:hypothetical protein